MHKYLARCAIHGDVQRSAQSGPVNHGHSRQVRLSPSGSHTAEQMAVAAISGERGQIRQLKRAYLWISTQLEQSWRGSAFMAS